MTDMKYKTMQRAAERITKAQQEIFADFQSEQRQLTAITVLLYIETGKGCTAQATLRDEMLPKHVAAEILTDQVSRMNGDKPFDQVFHMAVATAERAPEAPEMITYDMLYPDGSGERGIIMNNGKLPEKLRDIWRQIGSGEMEHVTVFWEGRYRSMYVNARGRLEHLPMNTKATEIYRNNVREHDPKNYQPKLMPWIAGPALLLDCLLK